MPIALARRLLDISLLGIALFIPFSIAGTNISIAFGVGGMVLSLFDPEARRRLGDIARDPLIRAVLLLAAVSLISVLTSDNLKRAWKDWRSYYLFVIYVLVLVHNGDKGKRWFFLWVLVISAALSSMVALIQGLGGLHSGFVNIEGAIRPSSTLYIMTFAGVIYQVILIALAVFFSDRLRGEKAILLCAGIAVANIALILNLTRGAWLALFAGVVLLARTMSSRKAWASVALLTLLYTLALIYDPSMRARWFAVAEDVRNPKLSSITTRIVLWDVSLEMIQDHPVMGVGMGDFSEEASARLRGRRVRSTTDAHNIFLQVLATQGIVGFLPFLFLWWTILRMFAGVSRGIDGTSHSYMARGALAVTVALLVGGLTENNIYDSEVLMAYLFIIAMAKTTQKED